MGWFNSGNISWVAGLLGQRTGVASKAARRRRRLVALDVLRLERRTLLSGILVTGAGPGGLPVVHVYSARTGAELFHFLAYDPRFRGGVHVAVGDLSGDGHQEIVTT